jgi:hypothetical protein
MHGEVQACGGCGAPREDLSLLLDMGIQPLPESRGATRRYPLKLMRCLMCNLVQLSYIPDPALTFKQNHPYSTGNSAALKEHYWQLANEVNGSLYTDNLVVDIGANDGTFLSFINARRIGVEPTLQGKKMPEGVTWAHGFFSQKHAASMREEFGPANVVTACNVLAHVPDPHDFMEGVRTLLAPDGLFITENHDVASVLDGLQIDTVYHEHARYYSPATLGYLLERHGFHTERQVSADTHGGSFRTYARPYRPNFTGRAKGAATALRAMIWKLAVDEKKTVYGVSAATRATPIMLYAGIHTYLDRVVEVAGSDKIGTRIPGTSLAVTDEQDLIDNQPDYAVLLAWHMKDFIIPKLRERGYRGKFIVPLPEPRVLDE